MSMPNVSNFRTAYGQWDPWKVSSQRSLALIIIVAVDAGSEIGSKKLTISIKETFSELLIIDRSETLK